ncbi:MAG: hypothetical protein K8953_07120, partial [Proteobacteria bacterium]|nr:hypothetical protein [Pseudomonadota bacterium]
MPFIFPPFCFIIPINVSKEKTCRQEVSVHYSLLTLLKQGISGNKGWQPVWRNPDPQPAYDVIIIGG